MLVETCIILDS